MGIYKEEEDAYWLVFTNHHKGFIEVKGKLYEGIEEYQFLQELMRNSFHQEICLNHKTTSRETIRAILLDIINKLIACFLDSPGWFDGDHFEITLLGQA